MLIRSNDELGRDGALLDLLVFGLSLRSSLLHVPEARTTFVCISKRKFRRTLPELLGGLAVHKEIEDTGIILSSTLSVHNSAYDKTPEVSPRYPEPLYPYVWTLWLYTRSFSIVFTIPVVLLWANKAYSRRQKALASSEQQTPTPREQKITPLYVET